MRLIRRFEALSALIGQGFGQESRRLNGKATSTQESNRSRTETALESPITARLDLFHLRRRRGPVAPALRTLPRASVWFSVMSESLLAVRRSGTGRQQGIQCQKFRRGPKPRNLFGIFLPLPDLQWGRCIHLPRKGSFSESLVSANSWERRIPTSPLAISTNVQPSPPVDRPLRDEQPLH